MENHNNIASIKWQISQVLYATPSECTHPRIPALALGLIAVVALLMARTIIDLVTGSLSYRRGSYHSDCSCMVAVFCSVVSW